MLVPLEEQFLRSRPERAQLLDTPVFEKVAAATRALLGFDSLVLSANLSPDLEPGEVGKRREGSAKKVGNARVEDLRDISRWMWVGKRERMLFASRN